MILKKVSDRLIILWIIASLVWEYFIEESVSNISMPHSPIFSVQFPVMRTHPLIMTFQHGPVPDGLVQTQPGVQKLK